MKTYTVAESDIEAIQGAAHSGAMLGGKSAYEACLRIEVIIAEILFRAGFDKSPGRVPEPVINGPSAGNGE